MKKIYLLLVLLLFLIPLHSADYIIKDYTFSIEGSGLKFLGATKDYAILKLHPIDKNKKYPSEDELEKFIKNYKIKLEATRTFETIDISYESHYSEEKDLNEVILIIKLKDSNHMIAMPYPSYSSSNGFSVTIKAKDTNFLGTLMPLNADIKLKIKDGATTPSFSIGFDFPFKCGMFDITLLNQYGISYTQSDLLSGFEWNTITGLNIAYRLKKVTFNIGFIQYTTGNLLFKVYDDYAYFTENFYLKVPITLTEFSNYTYLIYTPSLTYNWNWDYNLINIENDYITSPDITFAHTLENKKIVWNENFRTGYDILLKNSFAYNFQRQDVIPYISFETKLYWNYKANEQEFWNRFGICADIYAFSYIDLPMNHYKYGELIGERLRGFKDSSYFGNLRPINSTSAAIMLSIDLPHNVFTTHFSKEIINFNLQISPFVDMALVYDRVQDRLFDPRDGYYCGGLEILLYPIKWSSLTVRASLGFDLKNIFTSNSLLEGISKNKEIFIGIGLQY